MPSATAINVIFHQNVSSAGKIMWGKGIGKRTTPPNFSWSTPGEENIICYSLGPGYKAHFLRVQMKKTLACARDVSRVLKCPSCYHSVHDTRLRLLYSLNNKEKPVLIMNLLWLLLALNKL